MKLGRMAPKAIPKRPGATLLPHPGTKAPTRLGHPHKNLGPYLHPSKKTR